MRLYQIRSCPFAWRARIVLQEKQLPFETVLFEPDERPAELEAMSPDAKSPTLVDGEARLWESVVINEYLEDAYPARPLMPPEPLARAHVRAGVQEVINKLMPAYMGLMRERFFKKEEQQDPKAIAEARAKWHQVLALYDGKLAGRTFLVGDRLSLADVMLFTPIPTVNRLLDEELPPGVDHLRAWLERISARPAMRPL
jgi:glutathione S-transferase